MCTKSQSPRSFVKTYKKVTMNDCAYCLNYANQDAKWERPMIFQTKNKDGTLFRGNILRDLNRPELNFYVCAFFISATQPNVMCTCVLVCKSEKYTYFLYRLIQQESDPR